MFLSFRKFEHLTFVPFSKSEPLIKVLDIEIFRWVFQPSRKKCRKPLRQKTQVCLTFSKKLTTYLKYTTLIYLPLKSYTQNNVYSDIICWNNQGNAILIKDPSELAEKVLPIFFKHKNFTSYVRQVYPWLPLNANILSRF